MTHVKTPHPHPHRDIMKAYADDSSLCVFIKCRELKSWEASRHPSFDPDHQYFLCLPKHKDACLHWLNDGDTQSRHGVSQDWDDYNPIKSWSCGSIFMQDHAEVRIKPKKVKRWIGVRVIDGYTTLAMEAKRDVEWEVMGTLGDWQFVEIEIEV